MDEEVVAKPMPQRAGGSRRDAGAAALRLVAAFSLALALLPQTAVRAPAEEPEGKKEPQPRSITTVLAKANALLRKMDTADEAARDTIEETKVLAGEMEVRPKVSKVDSLEDGALIVIGTIQLARGPESRYTTREERQAIADLNKEIRNLRRERSRELTAFKMRNQRWNDKSSLEYTSFQRLKQRYDEDLAELRHDLKDLTRSINADAQGRREAAETVTVELNIEPPLRRQVDVARLMNEQRSAFTAKVRNYRVGTDPAEIGGDLFIEFLDLEAVTVEKKLLRHDDRRPAPPDGGG